MESMPPVVSVQRRANAQQLQQTRPDPSLTHVLDVEDVTIAIRGRTIIDDISFWIPKGEFVCLCGPNGAGKSTLLKAILGLLPTTAGKIRIGGQSVDEAHHKIGYVPQRKGFDRDFPARAVDLIVAALRKKWPVRIREHEREKAKVVLDKIGGKRLIDKPLAGLSGGETQRVFLARALITDPTLVILDEPTVGVDPQSRRHLFDAIRALAAAGMTVLYTSHYLEEVAELCDRVAIMDHGAVVASGTLPELIARHGKPPRLELELAGDEATLLAARALAARHGELEVAGPVLRLAQPPSLGPLIADLESAGARVVRITAQPTSLESVFLTLTGHALRDA